jgi:hypothetical protein
MRDEDDLREDMVKRDERVTRAFSEKYGRRARRRDELVADGMLWEFWSSLGWRPAEPTVDTYV